jgi:hypothetical protein
MIAPRSLAMISSSEEFGLLVKKWKNESRAVSVMSVVQASGEILSVVHVHGYIRRLSDSSLTVADMQNESIATVNFSNCKFNYSQAADLVGVENAKYYDDCIVVSLDREGEHVSISILSANEKSIS